SQAVVLFLVALANASFCRLFGGDLAAMAVVFMATLSGFMVKQLLIKHHADVRLTVIFCAFISGVLGATALLFSLGATPKIALATSVLYLVPGIPFINSFSDMLYRHYICAFSRFVDALVLTCCLSIGLCAAMLMMNAGMF
ncbi:MAG: threonine/serine exporter family protein, partial [Muribaculaceae bacterium]|nr:threonine/serine exporter family protein [Muribaculaceae bacterium]